MIQFGRGEEFRVMHVDRCANVPAEVTLGNISLRWLKPVFLPHVQHTGRAMRNQVLHDPRLLDKRPGYNLRERRLAGFSQQYAGADPG